MIDLQTTIDGLKDNGFQFITSYSNGVESWWGFDEEREVEVTIKINTSPDEEDIENFNENFIDEKMEARADLKRKYDTPQEAENQENFCN